MLPLSIAAHFSKCRIFSGRTVKSIFIFLFGQQDRRYPRRHGRWKEDNRIIALLKNTETLSRGFVRYACRTRLRARYSYAYQFQLLDAPATRPIFIRASVAIDKFSEWRQF